MPDAELAAIAHAAGLPFVNDLGSGSLVDLAPYGLPHEQTPQEAAGRRGTRGRGDGEAAAILTVHPSNFRMEGFDEEAGLAELVALGRKRRLPVLYDLGGGLMIDLSEAGLTGEPTLSEAVRSGATAVIASGDKLLGGPQAGILLGRSGFVARCRSHPFARAARAVKLTLAGLPRKSGAHHDRAAKLLPISPRQFRYLHDEYALR